MTDHTTQQIALWLNSKYAPHVLTILLYLHSAPRHQAIQSTFFATDATHALTITTGPSPERAAGLSATSRPISRMIAPNHIRTLEEIPRTRTATPAPHSRTPLDATKRSEISARATAISGTAETEKGSRTFFAVR